MEMGTAEVLPLGFLHQLMVWAWIGTEELHGGFWYLDVSRETVDSEAVCRGRIQKTNDSGACLEFQHSGGETGGFLSYRGQLRLYTKPCLKAN